MRPSIPISISILLASALVLACNRGSGSSDTAVTIDERFIEAHLDFAGGDAGDLDFAALAELGRDGAVWGCSAIDQHSYYGITITLSPDIVTREGEYTASQGYDALQVYFVHPSASDPARLRSTPVSEGTIEFTTVDFGGVTVLAGTFTDLRALADDADDPVDVTLVDGSFRCEGA